MKKLLTRTILLALVVQALYLARPSIAQAEEMCNPVTVTIDVKPGDSVNKINLSSKGLLPVAVLSITGGFDASQFTPEKANLGDASVGMSCEGAEAVRWRYEDVNGDGLVDLVFFFKVQELRLSLTTTTTTVMLMAHGSYGSMPLFHIMGTDSVIVKQ